MASGERIFSTSTYIQCRLAWNETNIDTANNTSKVWASMSYRRTNSYGGSTLEYGVGFHVIIGGQWFQVGDSLNIPPYDNNWHEVGVASRTITHNDDGSKVVNIGAYHQGSGLFNLNESVNVTLDTIPRASVPSVTPNPITLSNTANTLTVATNRKATAFTHDITCAIGSFSETKTGITDSTTFDIPKSVLASFAANSKTLSGTITCVTKNGNTTIGTKTASFSAQIDTSQEHPNIGTVTITDTNAYTSAIEAQGSYIRKASDLVVTIPLTVSGSYTELESATVACGNVVQNYVLNGTSQTITFEYDKIDTNGLTITVTDKRGTTATHTESWNLVPYIDLTVTGTVRRTTETGNEVSFTLTGQCFAGSFGQATNEIEVSYKYKLHSASTWTDGGQTWSFTPSGSGETDYTYTNIISGFAYDQQYDLIFTVKDLFTSASTRDLTLTKGIPVYGNGEDFLAVYGNLFVHPDRDSIDKFFDVAEAFNAVLRNSGVKNYLSIDAVTTAVSGVTFTVNSDGSVKATGTASATAQLVIFNAVLPKGKYTLSGAPTGCSIVAAAGSTYIDTGDGVDFELSSETTVSVKLSVPNGMTANSTFYPMIRDAEIVSDEFVQHYFPVKQKTYEFNSQQVSTSSGTGLNITLPNDFHKSLGCVLQESWPLQTWTNGAIVHICRDETMVSTARAGSTATVGLTASYTQNYHIVLVLNYM